MARKILQLRGLRLKVAMVVLVVMPAFLLFGYNNGSTGGITTLESFVKVGQFHRGRLPPCILLYRFTNGA